MNISTNIYDIEQHLSNLSKVSVRKNLDGQMYCNNLKIFNIFFIILDVSFCFGNSTHFHRLDFCSTFADINLNLHLLCSNN